MKTKLIAAFLAIFLSLTGGAYASDNTSNIKVYSAGKKIDTKSYSGVGLQYEDEKTNVVLEYGDDYTKASGVLKYDFANDFYIKGGVGYLKREMTIEAALKDVTQKTLGGSFGYGDTENYNIELGYIVSDLDGAARADGKSKISYIEIVGQHTFAPAATFDLVGSYQNANVFNKNYTDSRIEGGWFPVDDFRIHASHDSVPHDKDDYSLNAGVMYTFGAKQPWSPYIKGQAYQNSHVTVGFTYQNDIIKKSLQMRDVFENSVGTSEIVANKVAPGVFTSKTAVVEEETSTPAPAISTPTISLANQTVNDNGGLAPTNLPAPTVTGVNAGAVYSIVGNPDSGKISINSSTGVITWNGNLGAPADYTLNIKVLNTDTGTSTTTTNLHVNNNA